MGHYPARCGVRDCRTGYFINTRYQQQCKKPTQARTTRQAPSIRVHHAGHASHFILHLIHVLLWLAAFLSRTPLDRRETREWLRPGIPTCLRPDPTPL
uniref:Uncharacterized protein n=1 Tax=Mesocestoides corti TaxID=53468 RepID=A0A5K3G7U6_MESCO